MLAHLSHDVEAAASPGSELGDRAREHSPASPPQPLAGDDIVVPDSVGRYDSTSDERSALHASVGPIAEYVLQLCAQETVQEEGSSPAEASDESEAVCSPVSSLAPALSSRGYVPVRIPRSVCDGMLVTRTTHVHPDLLVSRARESASLISFSTDVDFDKALLIVSSDMTLAHGIVARCLLRGTHSAARSADVAPICEVEFRDSGVEALVEHLCSSQMRECEGAAVDDAILQLNRNAEQVPLHFPQYLAREARDLLTQQLSEQCLLGENSGPDERSGLPDAPLTLVSSRPLTRFTQPTVPPPVVGQVIDVDSDETVNDTDVLPVMLPPHHVQPRPTSVHPAPDIHLIAEELRAFGRATASAAPPPADAVIDVDVVEANPQHTNVGQASVNAESDAVSAWRSRASRLSRPKTDTANPLFRPQGELRQRYPCASAFHATYVLSDAHASRQCPYCANCHWMETLFNGKDAYCSWKHEPTVTKIQRSRLSESDKRYALQKYEEWRRLMASGNQQEDVIAEQATSPARVKQEQDPPSPGELPAGGAPRPASPTQSSELEFLPPAASSRVRKRRRLIKPNPSSEEPDPSWDWGEL